jgi:hypothetical protein|nr:MAG TPA: hypothetical protein [Crassvirales sp.]
MTEDLRQRVKLFGQLAIAYSLLNEEDSQKSKNLRGELQLEVFMPNTSLDKEGKTILVAIENSVISIGISLIAAQKYRIMPIEKDFEWAIQSRFFALELCSVGLTEADDQNQWYIDSYIKGIEVKPVLPSALYKFYGTRLIRLEDQEMSEEAEGIISEVIHHSRATLRGYLEEALEKSENGIDLNNIGGRSIIMQYSPSIGERFKTL